MEKKRIALIGAFQAHADKFVKLINAYEESTMVKVWAKDPEARREHAEMAECPEAETWEEILADSSIDGVIIMSPPVVHAKHIIAAAKAGKHVYVEKSLCITNEEADEIKAAVNESGIIFVMADPIVKPTTAYMKQKIEDGSLGEVLNARARNSFEQSTGDLKYDPDVIGRIKKLGGIVADTHTEHTLAYLLGKPVKASCIMGMDPAGRTDINTVILYEFENGAIGTAECCSRTGSPNEVSVYGEKGNLYAVGNNVYYLPKGGELTKIPDEDLPEAPLYQLHYWVKCLAENKQNDLYRVEDACSVVAMQNAAREAAGNAVEFSI